MLVLGSLLLGIAAALGLQFLKVEASRAWPIGLLVAAGVFCIGLSLRAALLP